MATITFDKERDVVVIEMEHVFVTLPSSYQILNPQDVEDAQCAYICALKCPEEGLPDHAVWLDSEPWGTVGRPDEKAIRKYYLARFGATDEQRERFANWDKVLDAHPMSECVRLANKYKDDSNTLGVWPVTEQSIAYQFIEIKEPDRIG